ncbi:NAD-dependent epimerase/dehydratase family protein [Chloroflexota bacterium]
MAILVTGGTGLIGINTARFLAEQGKDVVVFDRNPLPAKGNVLAEVMDRITVEIGNVADLAQVLNVIKKNKVDGIIHCAALMGTNANKHPIEALQTNIIGSTNMLEAARIMDLKRVIIVSSSAVMGDPEDVVTPRKEEEIVLPSMGIYPLSKLTCEHLTHTYRELYHVNAVSLRPRACYGPTEMIYAVAEHAHPIWKLVRDAVEGKPIIKESGRDSSFDLTYAQESCLSVMYAECS